MKVQVANPQVPGRSLEEPFWVDTDALHSVAPAGRLEALGIVPKFARDFVFADGKKDRRLVGEAAFSTEGTDETITCLVVFGPPESLFLLGATALENFGLQADPTIQKLRPITAVIGTARGDRAGWQLTIAPARKSGSVFRCTMIGNAQKLAEDATRRCGTYRRFFLLRSFFSM